MRPHLLHACALPEFRMFRWHWAQLSLRSAACHEAPVSKKKKKNPRISNTTHTRDYFGTTSTRPCPPSVHKSQHDVYTTKLLLRFLSLSKYLGTKSECFLGAARLRHRLSIMTFSEIGSGSLKCNDSDRCLSLQLHKS